MSSRNHYDSYAKFSGYNNQNNQKNSSYKTYDQLDKKNEEKQLVDRYSNVPPPKQNLENLGNLRNDMKGIQNVQKSHRVKDIDGPRLLNLLTKPEHHYLKNGQPMKILLKVYTDWCGPCKIVKPKYEELSTNPDYSEILFLKIDGEKMGPELTNLLKVGGVPAFFGFVAGKIVKHENENFVAGADINPVTKLCSKMKQI